MYRDSAFSRILFPVSKFLMQRFFVKKKCFFTILSKKRQLNTENSESFFLIIRQKYNSFPFYFVQAAIRACKFNQQ